MDYQEFLKRIAKIKAMNYVETHRDGPTGIGKTLEDLLEIKENNIAGPDFSNCELKATRKNSASMITLFTKKFQPDSGKKLLQEYGYKQRKVSSSYKQITLTGEEPEASMIPLEDKELHSTVDSSKPNSLGLKLSVGRDRVFIENNKNVEAYYDFTVLDQALKKKYNNLIHVLAEHKKVQKKEYFWYNEAYLYQGFRFETFLQLIRDGKMKVDIRIGHYPNGNPHDHGTGLRIMPQYLPKCFDSVKKVL
jgi:hypothetical protein